jgi:hypothetical protein
MLTVCWAVKGGSGTSTVTALLALSARRPTTLVDLDGDLPLILGVPPSSRPGIAEWAASETPADHLDDLVIEVAPDLRLLPAAAMSAAVPCPITDDRRAVLLDWCASSAAAGVDVIVDAGTGMLHDRLHDTADRAVLVTRNCYIALQRASTIRRRPTTVVLIREAATGLGRADVESAVGAAVGAELAVEPGIARTVNAGLLIARARRLSLSDGPTPHRLRPLRLGGRRIIAATADAAGGAA